LKKEIAVRSSGIAEQIIGTFTDQITFQDTFTPVTIQRYTGKIEGAIYGSPDKIKDGRTGYDNLFIAGTDQGFLGIVGSMLSGVTIVNQHILSRL
jgi:phytoene dehydrogenase-like protein